MIGPELAQLLVSGPRALGNFRHVEIMRVIEVRKKLIERYDEHVEYIGNTKEPRSKVHSLTCQHLIR